MRLLAWGQTDAGQKRDHNEDALLLRPELGLFAVADGMGGHRGGARASQLAVEILELEIRSMDLALRPPPGPGEQAPPAQQLKAAANVAGRVIYDLADSDVDLQGMGTTLTALLFHGGRVYLGHVGDSRAYLFRDGRLEQLTTDHSWIDEQVRAGLLSADEARESSLRHVITRSVGYERQVEVDLVVLPVLMGDCFLLCSDGLTNAIGAGDLRHYLQKDFFSTLPAALVQEANERGGEDNITAAVIYVANDTTSGDEAGC
jgi:protein phosphatase